MKWYKRAASGLMAAIMTLALAACGSNDQIENPGGPDGTHLNFSCYNYSNSMDPIPNANSTWCLPRYGVG